jgi:hypothetical protein
MAFAYRPSFKDGALFRDPVKYRTAIRALNQREIWPNHETLDIANKIFFKLPLALFKISCWVVKIKCLEILFIKIT